MMTADEEEEVTFDQSMLLTNRLKPHSRKKWCLKILKTAGVSLAFLALGLCIAIPGPTLIDLMERVNTNTQNIAYIFTARSGGYLLGSILGGFMFDRFDQQLLLCIILLLTAIATAAAPWCQTLIALAVMISFQGVSMGFLDTGGNIYCLEIWGKNSGPYMQTLHFCFGVGAFIAPLLAKPFLSTAALDPSLNGSLLHVRGSNIPLIMPAYGNSENTDGNSDSNGILDRDPRELPLAVRHAIFRRELLNNTEIENGTLSTSTIANVNVTITTTTVAIKPMEAPKKPSKTTDLNLKDQTADEDPTTLDKPDKDRDLKLTIATAPPTTLPTTNTLNSTQTTPVSTGNLTTSAPNGTNNDTSTNKSGQTKPISTVSTTVTKSSSTPAPTTTTTTPVTTTTVPQSTSSIKATVTSGNSNSESVTVDPHVSSTVISSESLTTNNSSNATSTTPHKPQYTVDEIFQTTINAIKNISKIQFTYLIIAAFLLLSSLLFMALYCWEKRDAVLTQLHDDDDDRGEITESRGFRIQMLSLLFFFYFVYVGMEVTFGGFVMTFAVQAFDWSKSQGTIVTAIFWGALAAGRGIAIFVARCCRPSIMLIIDLVITLIAALILSFAITHYHFMLWPGTLLLGLGLSSIFPTGISWAERYMKLTGKATAIMVVGSALGEMVLPVITGYFFETKDLMALMYIVLVLSTLACIMFVIMQNLASNRGDRYSVSKFLQLDEGESMEMMDKGDDVEIFNKISQNSNKKRVKFNLESNGTSYKPLRSSEEE